MRCLHHYTWWFEHYTRWFEHYTRCFRHYMRCLHHYTRWFEHYARWFEHYTRCFRHYMRCFHHYTRCIHHLHHYVVVSQYVWTAVNIYLVISPQVGPNSEWSIYFEYYTEYLYVIIFNEIILKISTIYRVSQNKLYPV